jgi:hypothetical protein
MIFGEVTVGSGLHQTITTTLLDMVSKILREFTGPDGHVRDTVSEIEDVDSLRCMDIRLRDSALVALRLFRGTSKLP